MGISQTWCQSGEFVLECENEREGIVLWESLKREGIVPHLWVSVCCPYIDKNDKRRLSKARSTHPLVLQFLL